KGTITQAVPLALLRAMPDPPDEFSVWCGLGIYSQDRLPPPWGNNVWSALVTSRARIRLGLEMERLAKLGGRVLYCDTDSAAFQGRARGYIRQATEPGQFELRGQYRRALIVGKKEYGLQEKSGRWKLYAKGVPESVRDHYLRNGSASFVRPVRFREAAR